MSHPSPFICSQVHLRSGESFSGAPLSSPVLRRARSAGPQSCSTGRERWHWLSGGQVFVVVVVVSSVLPVFALFAIPYVPGGSLEVNIPFWATLHMLHILESMSSSILYPRVCRIARVK